MLTMAENVIAAGADNRPPMLDKSQYNSRASPILLYIKGKEHAKEIWDRVKLLIEGSELLLQERESKLYDEFWYIYFSARSDNSLVLLELDWRKFAMEVKVAKDLHNTNFDHLYAHLRQHEAHANEIQYHQQLSLIAQQYYSPPAQQQSNDVPMVQQRSYQAPVANHSSVGRQTQGYAGSGTRSNATGTKVNKNEGTNTADNRDTITTCQQSQEIPTPAIFQTDDLDAFDFDYVEAPSASAVLMAKLSAYDSDVLSEASRFAPGDDSQIKAGILPGYTIWKSGVTFTVTPSHDTSEGVFRIPPEGVRRPVQKNFKISILMRKKLGSS
ncbi:hypothetical protein Tco_1212147 [Tanacetum coccineum]